MDRCIYCAAHTGEKPSKCRNFDQIFTFGGFLCPFPFTDPGQFFPEIIDLRFTLTRQISFEPVYCVTFRGRKTAHRGGSWTHPLYFGISWSTVVIKNDLHINPPKYCQFTVCLLYRVKLVAFNVILVHPRQLCLLVHRRFWQSELHSCVSITAACTLFPSIIYPGC